MKIISSWFALAGLAAYDGNAYPIQNQMTLGQPYQIQAPAQYQDQQAQQHLQLQPNLQYQNQYAQPPRPPQPQQFLPQQQFPPQQQEFGNMQQQLQSFFTQTQLSIAQQMQQHFNILQQMILMRNVGPPQPQPLQPQPQPQQLPLQPQPQQLPQPPPQQQPPPPQQQPPQQPPQQQHNINIGDVVNTATKIEGVVSDIGGAVGNAVHAVES
eukprot:Pgem_evm1s4625